MSFEKLNSINRGHENQIVQSISYYCDLTKLNQYRIHASHDDYTTLIGKTELGTWIFPAESPLPLLLLHFPLFFEQLYRQE